MCHIAFGAWRSVLVAWITDNTTQVDFLTGCCSDDHDLEVQVYTHQAAFCSIAVLPIYDWLRRATNRLELTDNPAINLARRMAKLLR